jgi:hypothetical protein
MARSFAEWVARITIGTTHLILFILSILSGRILSCTLALQLPISDLANRVRLGYGGVMRTMLISTHPPDAGQPDGQRRGFGHDVWERPSGCRCSRLGPR